MAAAAESAPGGRAPTARGVAMPSRREGERHQRRPAPPRRRLCAPAAPAAAGQSPARQRGQDRKAEQDPGGDRLLGARRQQDGRPAVPCNPPRRSCQAARRAAPAPAGREGPPPRRPAPGRRRPPPAPHRPHGQAGEEGAQRRAGGIGGDQPMRGCRTATAAIPSAPPAPAGRAGQHRCRPLAAPCQGDVLARPPHALAEGNGLQHQRQRPIRRQGEGRQHGVGAGRQRFARRRATGGAASGTGA